MLNDSISASPYDINFVVWKGGICDVQTSFTSILSVQPTAEQPLDTVGLVLFQSEAVVQVKCAALYYL